MVAAVTGVVVAAAAAVLVLLVIAVVAVVVVVVFIVVALLVVARKLNANRWQAFVLTPKTSLTNPVAQDILQAIDCNGDRLSGEWDPLHLDMAVNTMTVMRLLYRPIFESRGYHHESRLADGHF